MQIYYLIRELPFTYGEALRIIYRVAVTVPTLLPLH
jgi:hypothetical protein